MVDSNLDSDNILAAIGVYDPDIQLGMVRVCFEEISSINEENEFQLVSVYPEGYFE